MASNKDASKKTAKRSIGEVVKKTSMDFPVYTDTQLFIEMGTTLKWKQIKDTFTEIFKEELEDW